MGGLVGELSGHRILLDCAYLHYLTGVEALTGFIPIH